MALGRYPNAVVLAGIRNAPCHIRRCATEVLCDHVAAGARLIWNGQVYHEPTATAQLGGVRGSMRVEEQYADVLQNIESAIVAVYEDQPALLDIDVLDAIDALIRRYLREQEGRGAPNFSSWCRV